MFSNISSMVATKDSRIIANSGKIDAISNGKKTFLVGPNPDYKTGDSVGPNANV
jgi:hydroxyethylthiazole kinase-like sugar kinase family protein